VTFLKPETVIKRSRMVKNVGRSVTTMRKSGTLGGWKLVNGPKGLQNHVHVSKLKEALFKFHS
jgi:hypothetical protein